MRTDVPQNRVWHGSAGCTTSVAELEAVAAGASELDGDVHEKLADPKTVFHDLAAWAYVYDPDHRHVLLVHHRRSGRWMPPGGLVDADETPLRAAVRELHEETGTEAVARPDQSAVLVDVIDHLLPDGTPAATFGVAYTFVADMTTVLHPEPAQPAAWWPLASPPAQVAERHWARLRHHVPAG